MKKTVAGSTINGEREVGGSTSKDNLENHSKTAKDDSIIGHHPGKPLLTKEEKREGAVEGKEGSGYIPSLVISTTVIHKICNNMPKDKEKQIRSRTETN